MIKRNNYSWPIVLALFFILLNLSLPKAYPQQESKLEEAQQLYQHENYEEALGILEELKSENPYSSEIAYLLGLTYKRLQKYLSAIPELELAATLQPKVKNALIELIDLLYQCDKVEEAKKWIVEAQKESVEPAQTAFLNGLVILKEGKDPAAALKSFETAEGLDSSLAKSAKYQKAMANMQLKNFKEAKDIFKEIVVKDPATDLAGFANEYIDALTRQEEIARPFHGYLGYSIQYDDNVVYRPNDDLLAASATKHKDWRHVFNAQGDYNYKVTDKFSIKPGYSFYGTKQNDLGFYDMMSYDVSAQPMYYFEKVAVSLPFHYNYVTVDDKSYLRTVGVSNINNIMLDKDTLIQTQLQYNRKDYDWAVSNLDDNKSGKEYLFAIGWFDFFGSKNEGLINIRYAANYENTKGRNWTYIGNRLTFTSVVPMSKKLKWNFVADYYKQNFMKENTSYTKKRHDNVYTVSNLFAYEIFKNTELQLQHTFVYDDSSIGTYKYNKTIYSVGARYRF